MSAKRLQRIEKLVELALVEQDKAAQTLAHMQTQLETAEMQLKSLQSYQAEYAQKPMLAVQISPIQLQTHNAFSDKLSLALQAQIDQVAESQKMAELAEKSWIEKRSRVKALQALVKRIKMNELIEFNKQEQRMLDELASLKFTQNNSIIK